MQYSHTNTLLTHKYSTHTQIHYSYSYTNTLLTHEDITYSQIHYTYTNVPIIRRIYII